MKTGKKDGLLYFTAEAEIVVHKLLNSLWEAGGDIWSFMLH